LKRISVLFGVEKSDIRAAFFFSPCLAFAGVLLALLSGLYRAILLAESPRGLPGLALIGARKRTGVAVAEKPSDFRNRQIMVRKVTLGQIGSQCMQDTGKCQTLRRQAPSECSPARAELASDFVHLCFAMRQEHGEGILNPHSQRTSICLPMRQGFFTILYEQLVEI
jgi:hypothetical protein